jgi:hypothetical protein
MKKILPPLIVFAGAFLGTLLLQKNSFILQEYDGLFLMSRDYFTAMFRTPFPISGIIGDFLTQFFRFGIYAPLIVGGGVCLAFLLVRSILGRLSLSGNLIPAALSCGLWVVIAFAPTARRGVAIVLILCILWALSRLLPKRTARPLLPAWLELGGTVLLAGGVFLLIALNGTLRARERMATVRVAAVMSDWNGVLSVATPARTAVERELMPYAFLALGEKGRLGDELYKYPVRSRSDFDMSGLPEDYAHYFYNTMLYGTLQCPNEVIHSCFQLATYQEHGQSFLVLRRLLADYYAKGDYALAKKYAAVLSRSTLHAQYVRHFTERMAAGTPREPDSLAFRKTVPLLTRDPLSNLVMLGAGGVNAPASLDRILCSLLLDGDMENFRAVLNSARDRYPVLPRYYEEALGGIGLPGIPGL